MRAPQDAEILVAIVAGQLMAGVIAAGKQDDAEDVVDLAEDIVREVYHRTETLTA